MREEYLRQLQDMKPESKRRRERRLVDFDETVKYIEEEYKNSYCAFKQAISGTKPVAGAMKYTYTS